MFRLRSLLARYSLLGDVKTSTKLLFRCLLTSPVLINSLIFSVRTALFIDLFTKGAGLPFLVAGLLLGVAFSLLPDRGSVLPSVLFSFELWCLITGTNFRLSMVFSLGSEGFESSSNNVKMVSILVY